MAKWTSSIALLGFSFAVSGCGPDLGDFEQVAPEGTTEQELNAPVDITEDPYELGLVIDESAQTFDQSQSYFFPPFSSSWGLSRKIYDQGKRYYDQNWKSFSNRRYVVLIDLGAKSSARRFFLFDLKTGQVKRYLTSHGAGSDKNRNGWAETFSNQSGSKASSLGAYKTLGTYTGKHGRSLRLDGLSSTNSNALSRAIVVHGAKYIREKDGYAGTSWGCPALDNAYVQGVIDKIKGGALLYIGNSRAT